MAPPSPHVATGGARRRCHHSELAWPRGAITAPEPDRTDGSPRRGTWEWSTSPRACQRPVPVPPCAARRIHRSGTERTDCSPRRGTWQWSTSPRTCQRPVQVPPSPHAVPASRFAAQHAVPVRGAARHGVPATQARRATASRPPWCGATRHGRGARGSGRCHLLRASAARKVGPDGEPRSRGTERRPSRSARLQPFDCSGDGDDGWHRSGHG